MRRNFEMVGFKSILEMAGAAAKRPAANVKAMAHKEIEGVIRKAIVAIKSMEEVSII